MRDAREFIRKLWPQGIEGADEIAHDMAQAIANGRRESMENRRRELHEKIAAARREYETRLEPWIKELTNISLCDPPKPVALGDGRIMRYVGPLPTWEPDGLKMDERR
jgi:hypothetical protein